MGRTMRTVAILSGFFIASAALAQEGPHETLAKEIFAELIAFNTAPSGGNDMRRAISAIATRLRNAGFAEGDISIVEESEGISHLVVRYRAENPSQRPILLMAHIDVVEALPKDWSVEPFVLTEKDGYYYGRGTTDNKAGAAMLVANFIRLKKEGYRPDRDLIIMLTGNEETSGGGARILANEQKELIDAEFALNTDAGGIILENDSRQAFVMQTSEKIYVSYTFEATDPGGHSSVPRADSAVSRLARTLVNLEEFNFPIDLNETSRAFFRRWSPLAPAAARPLIAGLLENPADMQLSTDLVEFPYYNAMARTTCVATMLRGGHAENALPQSATATVNCRVLPQSSAEETANVLQAIAAKEGVTVTEIAPAKPSPSSPLDPDIVDTIGAVADELWPDIPVIPEMSTGATDGLFVRIAGIPVYGVSAIAEDPEDNRAHGQDERILAESFYDALEYWYRVVKAFSQAD